MDAWFGAVLSSQNVPPERRAIEGRVALMLCDGSEKWPYAFLDDKNIPEDFRAALEASSMQAGPDMVVSSMVPRPIDLGPITEAAGDTLERFERWPILRTLLLWMVFACALAGIFYATR
jgi:hypothetical protein